MAFNFNAALTSAFAAVPVQVGDSGQGLPLYQTALNAIKAGTTPAATPVASVPYQAPKATAVPVTQTPFTIAGIGKWIGEHKAVSIGAALILAFVAWKAYK